MNSHRSMASFALAALALGLLSLLLVVLQTFPRGLFLTVALAAASALAWQGLVRSGKTRILLWSLAGLLLLWSLDLLLSDGIKWFGFLGLVLIGVAIICAKQAFSVRKQLPPATPPQHPVVVWNPKSGGGKALSNNLDQEARKRGIEPIELKKGDDLVALVQAAVARGADGLMAAGGDGTQALVATIAAEHDLPFACIPAGTRNHFALDLGVDRDDVVGALDAFVNGWEKRVDLGEVAGRTFVNNVSLGIYAEAVQSKGYRDAKIRTLLATAPSVLERSDDGHDLRWIGPDGKQEHSAAVILVSNNPYRLGHAIGSGTRPHMNLGTLGVAVMGATGSEGRRHALTDWTTKEFAVESGADIAIGVDGEALKVPSPVKFRIRPGALRVRIAPQHPGASPSAAQPEGFRDALRRLVRIAGGADPLEVRVEGH